MTYKNELTTQIQKPVDNIQQTFATPKIENPPSFQQETTTLSVAQSPSFSFQRQWLLVVIPLVSVGIFLYHWVGYLRFCRLLRQTFQQPSPVAAQVFESICKQLNIRKHVRLVETPVLSAPLCIGVFRPTIVIPTGTHTEKELRPILYHELTHQKHKDVWVKWLTLVAVSLHFFNPLVYWLRKELNLYGELRCDERVIASMERDEKQYYGQLLIQMATQPRSVVGGGFAAMSEEKQSLKERLVAIMKYKKKSRWIQVFSIAVVGIAAFCLVFSGMTFANDEDAIMAQLEKVERIRNQSKWADFPQQLKAAQLLPTALVDRCNEVVGSYDVNHFHWEEKGHGTGLMILLKLRGDELLNYEYRNGGGTKVAEEIHPIDTTQAVEKALDFLKTYHIGTPELTEKLAKGTVNQSQMTIQPVETKNPNYHVTKITMELGGKDRYDFTVDMNMGGIIAFDNLYEGKLAERDVALDYHTILNGKDYVDQVQPGQVYLWTSKTGRVWDLNFLNNFSVTVTFDNKEALMTALKNANHERDFPAQLDFKQASVEYYLTPDNIDYRHPIKTINVEEDVYFKVYDLKGDYKKNIKEIFVSTQDGNADVGYRYMLTNDIFNFYKYYDPSFRLVPEPVGQKDNSGKEIATASTSASIDPDYQPPVETITHLQHSSFDGAILEETAYADGNVNYSIDAIKRIPPIQCYDRFNESNHSELQTFTGVEVFYFGDGKAAKEKIMALFQ